MATTNTPGGGTGLPAGATGTWTLDPSSTTAVLRTKALWGLARVKGSFKAVEGAGTVNDDGAVTGTLTIDAASIDTGNKKRDDHLRSADFFESDKYPTFTYTATGASPAGGGKVKVTGTLTVHGVTRPLDIETTVVQADPATATLKGEFDLDRSEWGITWSKMGAQLTNHVVVNARFTKT